MTDQTTETRVAEIEKRAEKATKGPWKAEDQGKRGAWVGRDGDWAALSCGHSDEQATDNGAFIAHARSDIPWLTAQLRAAWKREAALREALLKIKGITSEAFNTADYMGISKQMELKIAKVHRIAALQETADE